ncbi:MAG: hypothetical protein MZV65_42400 [Chromatiales bacterium]|nr:hypothetical protein [Chromatiales bacterium]
MQTLGLVLAEDQEEQTKVTQVINQLRSTIENNAPIEVLSREAMNAIETDLPASRASARSVTRGCSNDLTGEAQSLRGELDAAQREMDLDASDAPLQPQGVRRTARTGVRTLQALGTSRPVC